MKQIIFMSPDEITQTAERLLNMLSDPSLVVDILLDDCDSILEIRHDTLRKGEK